MLPVFFYLGLHTHYCLSVPIQSPFKSSYVRGSVYINHHGIQFSVVFSSFLSFHSLLHLTIRAAHYHYSYYQLGEDFHDSSVNLTYISASVTVNIAQGNPTISSAFENNPYERTKRLRGASLKVTHNLVSSAATVMMVTPKHRHTARLLHIVACWLGTLQMFAHRNLPEREGEREREGEAEREREVHRPKST